MYIISIISLNTQVTVFHDNKIMLVCFTEDGFPTEIIKELNLKLNI